MLLAESVPVEFSRSEKIVNEGEINSDLYIVSHGVWRAYRLKDGIEMSMWFAIEGSLAFSVFMPAEKNARTDSTNPSQTFGLIPEHDPPITQPYTGLSGPIAAYITFGKLSFAILYI